ncbi:MAG: hypothetical protein GY820_09825 [Gammaproteobacteria bacterium]|nr:hypothetical protein [Gammaproteobacteria bacterium]
MEGHVFEAGDQYADYVEWLMSGDSNSSRSKWPMAGSPASPFGQSPRATMHT